LTLSSHDGLQLDIIRPQPLGRRSRALPLPINARCTLASPLPQLTHDREQHAGRQFRREEESGLGLLELTLDLALLAFQDGDALPGGVELGVNSAS
jgi:hypothetical protein